MVHRPATRTEIAMHYTATFYPQAWVNGHAIDVDPEGDVTWTPADQEQAAFILDEEEARDARGPRGALDSGDTLKDDANAPAWVRAWQGPFTIFVDDTP